jgi:hypothetical protein
VRGALGLTHGVEGVIDDRPPRKQRTIYYVTGIHKVGCTSRFEGRLREQGIPEGSVRVLETLPRELGPKPAGERERFWSDLLGTDLGTRYDTMLKRRRPRRVRSKKGR